MRFKLPLLLHVSVELGACSILFLISNTLKKERIKDNPPNLKYFHFSFTITVCICLMTDVSFTAVQFFFFFFPCTDVIYQIINQSLLLEIQLTDVLFRDFNINTVNPQILFEEMPVPQKNANWHEYNLKFDILIDFFFSEQNRFFFIEKACLLYFSIRVPACNICLLAMMSLNRKQMHS